MKPRRLDLVRRAVGSGRFERRTPVAGAAALHRDQLAAGIDRLERRTLDPHLTRDQLAWRHWPLEHRALGRKSRA
ncbi:hypothetical protein [Dactylosporangium sp. CA-092794]|uniref:hypothetical protein n=1 Tax=Dactylosporangium sp. CA-092794 TaxID=3239929 RepID=UPI003D8A9844